MQFGKGRSASLRSAAALAVTGLLAVVMSSAGGCQSDPGGPTDTAGPGHADAMTMPAAASDGEFAAMMVQHHASAIDMSTHEARNGSRQEVRDLARKIADAQAAEKPRFEAIAREEGRASARPDPRMVEQSARTMRELRAARGEELDRLFLIHMVAHHETGNGMATDSMPNLSREDLRAMARKMIDDQSREVAQMRDMLDR